MSALTFPQGITNTPESFIYYLDNHFRAEINLEEQEEFQLTFDSSEKQSGELSTSTFKQCEIGHIGDTNITFSEVQLDNMSIDATYDASQNNEAVKLNYRGQKNNLPKGKNSERADVILKTFFRALKRLLWEIFAKENEINLDYGKHLHSV